MSTVHCVLVRNNEPRRSISEACTIYPKCDFSGDLVELARICGFIEDCAVAHDGKLLFVQTSTTHLPQIEVIEDIFERYGHVSRTSGYNKHDARYQ